MPSTSRRPADTRDTALLLALLAILCGLLAMMSMLIIGATATTILTGGGIHLPAWDTWLAGALRIVTNPGHPGTALEAPWARGLDEHVTLYWASTIGLSVYTVVALVALGVWASRRLRPAPAGHATRTQLHHALSAHAARRTAAWTRPSLTPEQLRRAPVTAYAVPLHRGPQHQALWTDLESPTGCIAPTRGGKSRRDVVHKILAAPGALICSSTKPDLLEMTALARARRPGAGPVLVFDATGTVSWPAALRHSPITGCVDPQAALRRATTLVDTGAIDMNDTSGNDPIFRQRSKAVLQCYLLAAHLAGHTVTDMTRWAITRPLDHTPAGILREHGYHDLATNLVSEMGMVAETADAVWLAVRRVLEPFLDPSLAAMCTPHRGHAFDPEQFLRAQGSLFIVADQDNPAARPVLSALLVELLHAQQRLALRTPDRRLDPPVTTTVDELLLGTPIPQLPAILADSAGRGALIHWWAQSRAQLDQLYGTDGARTLVDNTLTLSVLSGLHDDKTLDWLSTLAGHHERLRHHHNHDGMLSPGRTGTSTETVPTLRAGDIRALADDDVLILHRHLHPIVGHTTDLQHRGDATQLQADIATVRAGTAPITPDGYLTTRRPVQPLIPITDADPT